MLRTIDYIENLQGHQHELMLQLHSFIMSYEGITTKLKYGLPFYSATKIVCYANPQKKGGFELVFWHTMSMKKNGHYLDRRKRKWFGGIIITELTDDIYAILDQLMLEAIALDSQKINYRGDEV